MRFACELAWIFRTQAIRNLESNYTAVARQVYGTEKLTPVSRRMIQLYAANIVEVIDICRRPLAVTTHRHCTVESKDSLLERCVGRPTGVVVALPRLGHWAGAVPWLLVNYPRTLFLVTNAPLAKTVLKESTGGRWPAEHFIVMTDPPGRQSAREFTRAGSVMRVTNHLLQGGIVCVMGDVSSERTVPVNFFSRTARLTATPARLAAITRSTLLAGSVHGSGSTIEFTFAEITSSDEALKQDRILTLTQGLAYEYERAISLYPEQWHATDRLFSDE